MSLVATHEAEPRIARVQEVVARRLDTTLREMRSDLRGRAFARPRQIAMWLARSLTSHGWIVIGHAFNRDHTTVMHAFRVIEARRTTDVALARLLIELEQEIVAGCSCAACAAEARRYPADPPQLLLPVIWPGELPLERAA
jgi:chromosomal replication initiator protein